MAEIPNVVYGRLLESVHISGYSAARACDELEWLVEDDRWKSVGPGFDDGNEFAKTINLSEFQLAVDRRKNLAKKLFAIQATQRVIGSALGVTQTTVGRDLETNVSGKHKPEPANQRDTGNSETNVSPAISLSGSDAAGQLKRLQDIKTKRQNRDDEKKANLQTIVEILSPGIIVGDFRGKSAEIADSSAELIFTDPPYDRDSLSFYSDIAEIGARILKPGGSLIAYCGQYLLPEILPMMQQHLRFWWINACFHSSDATKARMNAYGIVVHWKPMVWFVKGERGDRQTFVDDVVRGAPEKTHHEWQQRETDASYYIEKLSSPAGLVVDFFAGGGTTCVAAQRLGRPWIAFEIDPVTATKADQRLVSIA